MRSHRTSVAILAALLAASTPAAAQRVHFTVVRADSTTVAAGVIVELLNIDGRLVLRGITSAKGNLDAGPLAPTEYRARALRIGFLPTLVPPFSVRPGETATVRIVLGSRAVSLPSVAVRTRDECRLDAESGRLVTQVWEEARKALMSSQLAADDAPLDATWIAYDRTLDATGRIVRGQQVRTTRTPTTHAFMSWPADSLAARGWVVERNDETSFYAPDAEVLLSESFASAHCFHLQPAPRDSAQLIGVSFEPARETRGVADVEGTFWLDRASAELRALEFRYTGLPNAAREAGAGGRVEFLRLGSGNWLVNRWHVVMPFLGAANVFSTRRIATATAGAIVKQLQVSGAVVTTVSRGGISLHNEPMPSVLLQVASRDPQVKSGGATVTLAGTDYEATADPTGLARFDNVLPGRYRAEVRTSVTEGLGALPIEREVEARLGRVSVDSVSLPTGREFLKMICATDASANGPAQLYGFVRDSTGRGAPQAAVTVSWLGRVNGLGAGGLTRDGRVGVTRPYISTLTNDLGIWHSCGLPRGQTLLVRSETDGGEGEASALIETQNDLGTVDVDLRRRGTRATHDSATVLPALLEIRVTDLTGGPVPGVALEVRPSSGANRRAVTNDHGLALVANLDPGLIEVSSKRLGYKPGAVALAAAGGRNTVSLKLDANRLPALDTVRVMGSRRVSSRFDEFETRRLRREATASFSREDIIKRNPVDTWQMLTAVPSVTVGTQAFVVYAKSARGPKPNMMDPRGPPPCYMRVMVDGVMLTESTKPSGDSFTDLSQLPRPAEIHGIEVFAGPAAVPIHFSGGQNWCGLIAVWTRDR